jgi:hypothetical protein
VLSGAEERIIDRRHKMPAMEALAIGIEVCSSDNKNGSHRPRSSITGTYLETSNVNPHENDRDEFLCTKNMGRACHPDTFVTSAKDMENAALDSG